MWTPSWYAVNWAAWWFYPLASGVDAFSSNVIDLETANFCGFVLRSRQTGSFNEFANRRPFSSVHEWQRKAVFVCRKLFHWFMEHHQALFSRLLLVGCLRLKLSIAKSRKILSSDINRRLPSGPILLEEPFVYLLSIFLSKSLNKVLLRRLF